VLTTQVRDLPARQQTLQGTIAWSYNLLLLEEQQLFRRLAVFVDGCTCQAAEQVCTAASELEGDMLEMLASLVDKSLLQQVEQADGEVRFRMLQTLREYGLERLAAEEESETTHRAHAGYYLALAGEAEAGLTGLQQAMWLERLEQEHENLRAAIQWLLEQAEGAQARNDEAEMALRLVGDLWRFWLVRGYHREGRSFLERAMAVSKGAPAALRAKALTGASWLVFSQTAYDEAEAFCRESLALYRQLGQKEGMALALQQLAVMAHAKNEYARARPLLEEALALFKEIENQEGIASTLDELAYGAIDQGEYSRARELAEQALTIFRKVGDKMRIIYALLRLGRVLFFSRSELAEAYRLAQEALTISREVGYKWGLASSLGLVGELALLEGDDATARTSLEEALSIRRELKDPWGIAWGLYALGSVYTFQGDYATARRLYEESLTIVKELDDKEFIASCLERLGVVVAAQQEPAWAARLWGAAETLRQSIDTPMAPVYRASYERALAASRQALGEQVFAAAWAQGRRMTPEQAVAAEGKTLLPTAVPPRAAAAARSPSRSSPFGLTAREVEVLRLLAQGLSDAEIAEQLVIARRTVNWYLTSIYSKLGVSSRAAATRYALEQHLV
jgi:predicted ATPase/DNA-binding CsgD family transcriptional regulator